MKLIDKRYSAERCTEAGWRAYDYILDEPMSADFILRFRRLGSFVFMTMLREPFFKVESDYFIVKGIEHRHTFRVAVHADHEHLLRDIEAAAFD